MAEVDSTRDWLAVLWICTRWTATAPATPPPRPPPRGPRVPAPMGIRETGGGEVVGSPSTLVADPTA